MGVVKINKGEVGWGNIMCDKVFLLGGGLNVFQWDR